MNSNDLITLVASAAKSNEDAKAAEAHARACKVYARKVEKETNISKTLSVELFSIANDMIKKISNSGKELSPDKIKLFQSLSNDDQAITNDIEVIQQILEMNFSNKDDAFRGLFEKNNPMNKDYSSLTITDEEIEKVQRFIDKTREPKAKSYDEIDESVDNERCHNQNYDHMIRNNAGILVAVPPSLVNNQQGVFGVATKRKSRRRTKARAMGIPSPLLSMEEVTIVKRATSPNPSQHSGLSPFVGTQHKYSVLRKRSTTSQQTMTDDEDARPTSPFAGGMLPNQTTVTSPLTLPNRTNDTNKIE